MAMATQHPYAASSSSDLNNHASAPQQYANGNGKHRHAYYRPAEDDDSIATEQFPEFDPSHDGSEEDENHAPHYTHSTAMNGKPETKQQSNAHRHDEQDEDENDDDDTRSLSPVEPLPEPPHDDDGNSIHTQQTTPVMTSPVNSPPYWAHGNHQSFQSRTAQDSNNLSTESLVPRGGITLQDNEAEEDGASAQQAARDSEETRTSYGRDRNKACWARSVEVTNYVIVNGSTTNIGAFVVWNIRVQTLSVSIVTSLLCLLGWQTHSRTHTDVCCDYRAPT